MRIGVDVRALMEKRTTGVQVYIINLLEALFKIDSQNQYLLFANGVNLKKSDLPRFDYPNVRHHIFNYPNKFFNLSQKLFNWPKIDGLLDKINLFFSPHWRTAALSKNIPLIITFHDLSFEIVPEFFSLRQRLWHKFMGYRQAAQRADRIIAVSENTKQDLIDIYKVPEDKIAVIYSGAPHPSARRVRGDYFLFFATFEPRKNLDTVLAAYDEYRQKSKNPKPLILAGSTGWKTRLERAEGKIQIYENVTEEQKAELYQNCFALLFPSFYEGFGFPVLEAAAFGRPVIASFATSLAEIGKGFTLFVNPFRPQQITAAMIELESDPKLYEELSSKAKQRAGEFSWERTARATLELFKKYDK